MTLNKFREEYSRVVDELPEFHMDAGRVQDQLHHRRMEARRRSRLAVKGCTAAAVFLLCGAGTVAAKNYVSAVIEVHDNGYTVTGGESDEDVLLTRMKEEDYETDGADLDFPDSGISALSEEDGCIVESAALENQEYGSLQEFLESSPVAARIPDITMLQGEFEGESVNALDDGMMVCVMVLSEEKYFSLSQFDYRGLDGYSSGTAYTGEAANERNYTNSQGLSYVVFDTIGEDGQVEATHAVISVEGRQLSVDFQGFDTGTVEKVLTDMDLTMYFSD